MTLKKLSVRIDEVELKRASKLLGLSEDSKTVRACINFTNNVALNMFGGNIQNMFKRKKKNIEVPLYDNNI